MNPYQYVMHCGNLHSRHTVHQVLSHPQLSSQRHRKPQHNQAFENKVENSDDQKWLSAGKPCKAPFSRQPAYCKYPREQSAMHMSPTKQNNSEWLHPITLDIVSPRTFDWVKPTGHKWSDGVFINVSYGVFY